MIFVGIDPGNTGGVAIVHEDGSAQAWPMPVTKNKKTKKSKIITDGILSCIGVIYTSSRKGDLIIGVPSIVGVIEKAQPMRKGGRSEGSVSIATYLQGYGEILGTFNTLRLPLREINSKTWKSSLFAGSFRGKNRAEQKEMAIAFVREHYPDLPLVLPRCRKPHDGMADAVCIAHYAKQSFK